MKRIWLYSLSALLTVSSFLTGCACHSGSCGFGSRAVPSAGVDAGPAYVPTSPRDSGTTYPLPTHELRSAPEPGAGGSGTR